LRAGGDQEMIERFLQGLSGFQVFAANRPFLKVDGRNAVMNPGSDVQFFPVGMGGTDNQGMQRIDNPADVIRKRSGRIGSVGALFENDDLPLRFSSANLRCSAHAGGIAADYNQPCLGH